MPKLKGNLLYGQSGGPTAVINSLTPGDTTIDVDVTVTDSDTVISGNLNAVLYLDGALEDTIGLATGANNIQFTGLLTGTEYEVRIVSDYDLLDGNGTVATVQLATGTTTTVVQVVPTVSIEAFEDWTFTPNIIADVTIGADTDNVATDTGWVAYLYVDGVLQGSQTCGSSGNLTYSMSNRRFGRFGASNYALVGQLGPIQIYNRVLSGDEIIQNYEAQRVRFGV